MKSQGGFTLIETMIAMVILAVGLTGVIGISTMSYTMARDNDKWTESRIIAESEIEQRGSLSIDALDLAVETAPQGTQSVTHNHQTYSVEYWYTQPATNRFRIIVRVSYPNAQTPVSMAVEKNIYL